MSNCLTLTMGDPSSSSITFCPDSDSWIMKIERTETGSVIRFNTEDHPNCMPEAFAKAVCEILCTSGYLDNIYKEFPRTSHRGVSVADHDIEKVTFD